MKKSKTAFRCCVFEKLHESIQTYHVISAYEQSRPKIWKADGILIEAHASHRPHFLDQRQTGTVVNDQTISEVTFDNDGDWFEWTDELFDDSDPAHSAE
jgi:hypothetical protein